MDTRLLGLRIDASGSLATSCCDPLEYCARTDPPASIDTLVSWAAGNPSWKIAEEADGCANWLTRPTPTGGAPAGAICQGDQSIFCGLRAPLFKVSPIPSIKPFAVLYPVPVTVSNPPLGLNLNDHGPAGSILVTAGSVDEIEASHVLTPDLVNVAEITCALPSESYVLTGTEKVLPTVAEASRLRLALNAVVAFAARLAPTGTRMSPIGPDGSNWPVIVFRDQPWTR